MEVKNLVTASLVIFIVVITMIFGGVFMARYSKSRPSDSISQGGSNVQNTVNSLGIKMDQIALHNTSSDCWVVVNNRVYDVTDFIPQHPGGPEAILPLCGKDATSAFESRNGRGPHPQRAQEKLDASYFVGPLEI